MGCGATVHPEPHEGKTLLARRGPRASRLRRRPGGQAGQWVSDLEPNAVDYGVPDEEQLDEGRQWEARRLPAVGDTHAGSGDPISGV